jgi:molecular chaperone HtpG
MSQTLEQHPFQAETKELLQLVIHSLYAHKEIFLRELVSNASDALDKLRFESLTRPELLADDPELGIRLEVDAALRELCVIDNGVGMTRADLAQDIGTIARSGTQRFLAALREARPQPGGSQALPEMIGQFGVGFYSAFMVADEVVIETRRAGEGGGTRWSSRGEGSYTLEDIERAQRGTIVRLRLKPIDRSGDRSGEDDLQDFADPALLRSIVKRYSDFIAWPIRMSVGEGQDARVEVVNSQQPLWTRPKGSISVEDYARFYRHLAHDWHDPLETIHFRAEGGSEYTVLIFLPRERPFEHFDPAPALSRIHLYVRHVFVQADCAELAPPWLRFVRGVVDSSDLPLNVSRETLQHARALRPIQKRLVRKVLDACAALLDKRRADYAAFFRAFGPILKEGLWAEEELRAELAGLCLWSTSASEELTTLAEYVERMPVSQREIYVLLGRERADALRSPHLEALRARGLECLLALDPVDEFVLQRLTSWKEKSLRRVDAGTFELEGDAIARERLARQRELEPLLEAVRKELADEVEAVRFSSRLADSPACLVAGEHALSPELVRFLRESGRPVQPEKRVLELNAGHELVRRLHELSADPAHLARFAEACQLLHGLALVAEGDTPRDPARFTRLVSELFLARGRA